MAVDERRRLEAFRDLAAAIGDDATRTVFDLIDEPRHDPAARGETAALRADLGQLSRQVQDVSTQLDRLAERMDERFVEAREHVDVRIDALRHELVATFESGLREAVVGQTRIIVFSLVTAFAAVSAVAIGIT